MFSLDFFNLHSNNFLSIFHVSVRLIFLKGKERKRDDSMMQSYSYIILKWKWILNSRGLNRVKIFVYIVKTDFYARSTMLNRWHRFNFLPRSVLICFLSSTRVMIIISQATASQKGRNDLSWVRICPPSTMEFCWYGNYHGTSVCFILPLPFSANSLSRASLDLHRDFQIDYTPSP